MAGITRHEREINQRLDTLLSIPVTAGVAERLAKLASREQVTRTEFVRAIIMRAIEPQTEEART